MAFIKATPYARKIAGQYHIDLAAVTPSGPGGAVLERDVLRAREGRRRASKVHVTPLARRIAEELHVDLDKVKGTGLGGKICREDVLAASDQPVYELQPGELREPLSGMRKTIARRMSEAAAIPTVTITTKADVTGMEEMRLANNEKQGVHYTVNDLILKACARALLKHKRLLCSFAGDSIIYKNDINIGIAVSTGDGLLVPVLRDADTMTLDEISVKAREIIKRARERHVTPEECEGSTFTVTNLGMYGVEAFTPLIHAPNAAILGVCSMYEGVTVRDGMVEARKLMHLCLTFDHRLMDAAEAAGFNLSVREFLEHPESLYP